MTYRMKLFILIIALVVVSNGALAAINYFQCNSLLEVEVHRKARAIASTAAALIEPELVRAIRQRRDEARPDYARLRAYLRRVRDLNRREDVWIESIYTLVSAPQDARIVEYGVDAEDRFEYTHHAGDVYLRNGNPVTIGLRGISQLAERLKGFQAGYGAAFAPVRDQAGNLVGIIGVSLIPAPFSVLRHIGPAILASFAAMVVLGMAVAALLARSFAAPLQKLQQSVEAVGNGNFQPATLQSPMSGEFATMAAAIRAMAAGLRERDTIKRAFSGYISRQVLDSIVKAGELPALKGERRRITVMFADIRGFTAMAEGMRPEGVVEVLREFFDGMVEVILRHSGTIDKFLGDGIMVIFGAPLDDQYQEEHAIKAALEMQGKLRNLCHKWETEGRRSIHMGIGINSGAAVVGNIGSEEHMEYTAIGDTVNLASRLESASKELGLDIVVSEHTYHAVRPLFCWKFAGEVLVRGRTEPVRTYSLEELDSNEPPVEPVTP